nr:MAG TPA: hypothetical protein [Caudoviricetes sp.]
MPDLPWFNRHTERSSDSECSILFLVRSEIREEA